MDLLDITLITSAREGVCERPGLLEFYLCSQETAFCRHSLETLEPAGEGLANELLHLVF